MKDKGQSTEPVVLDAEASDEQLDSIINAETKPPIRPSRVLRHRSEGKAYEFYKSVNWPEWWEEFNGELDKNGYPRYRSVWAFIKVKTKEKKKQDWLYQMIGPKPEFDPTKRVKLLVPWLGDWAEIRNNGLWSFEDPGKLKALAQAIKERQQTADAARSLAPLVFQELSRWARLEERLEQVFMGRPFLDDKAPAHKDNLKRARNYFRLLGTVAENKRRWMREWCRIHGFDPEFIGHTMLDMAKMGMAVSGQVGAAAALTGAIAAGGQIPPQNLTAGGPAVGLPEGVTVMDAILAGILNKKSEIYGMQLPESLDPKKAVEKAAEDDKKQKVH